MRKLAVAAVLVCLIAITLPASVAAQTAPSFVGVRTFLSAPYEPDLDKLHADFAVLGVPFDEGTWGQPGERYGPRDLREDSQEYAHDLTEGFYYIDGDRTVLKGKRWVDVGDVIVYPTVPVETGEKNHLGREENSREKSLSDYLGRRSQHHIPGDPCLRCPANGRAH